MLEYDEIRFLGWYGWDGVFLGYDDEGIYQIDLVTGEILTEVQAMGGWRIQYQYLYDVNTKSFYYEAEYDFHPEDIEFVIHESQNTVLSVSELAEQEYDKFAIYFNGEFVSDFIYDEIIGGNSIAFVRQNGKYAFADHNGNLLTDFEFDDVTLISGVYVAVKKDTRWGFVDTSGEEMIPYIFDDALNIDEDTAFVKYKGRYGILDVRKTAGHLSL